jgi:hypothetical protein
MGLSLLREEGSDYYWSFLYWRARLSLTTKLLLVLASTVILGSESQGTHDLVLLADGSDSYFIVRRSYLHNR